MFRSKLLTFLFLLFLVYGTYAQKRKSEPINKEIDYLFDLELEELFNLEVSGSSRILKKSAAKAPAQVLIITKKQIENRGYLSLIELLEDLPGFKVDRLADPRYLNDVSIRGLRYSDKFIIMIDGVRVSSPTNEIIPIFENYPIHFAEQIEIIYGSASALYGADALSGVINIISKNPEEINGTELRVEGGQYGYGASNLLIGKKINRNTSFLISGQFMFDKQPSLSNYYEDDYRDGINSLKTGSFNTIFGNITPKNRVIPLEEHRRSAYGIHARFNFKNLSFNYFSNYALLPSSTANNPSNAVYNRSTFLGQYINTGNINYSFSKGKWTSTSYIVGSRYDLDPWSNFRNVFTYMEPAYLYSFSWKVKAEQIINYSFSDKSSITAGATSEYFFSVPRSNDLEFPLKKFNPGRAIIAGTITSKYPEGIKAEIQEVQYTNQGAYIEYDQKFLKSLIATIGIRYDINSRFGSTVNPRIGLVWSPSEVFSIKGIYGSAYLEPSPQYTFDQFGHLAYNDSLQTFQADFAQLANSNLKPQTIHSFETATKFLINEYFILDASLFLASTKGLIAPLSIPAGAEYTLAGFPVLSPQIYANLGKQLTYGLNIGLNYQHKLNINTSWSLNGSYGYLEGTLDHDEDGKQIRNLPGISNHTFKIASSLKFKNLTSSLRIIAMDKQRVINTGATQIEAPNDYQEIDGYWIANFYAEYKFSPFDLYVKADNLFNNRYRNVNLGAAPEGNISGSASAEFQQGAPQNPIRIYGGFKIHINQ